MLLPPMERYLVPTALVPEHLSSPFAQVQSIGVAAANVNHDGVINILDLVLVASNFGQTGRNLQGDVNRDGIIDVFDLVRIAKYFGQDVN